MNRRTIFATLTALIALSGLLVAAPDAGAAAPPRPAVATLSVGGGPAAGGTRLTVRGSSFTSATTVLFGTTAGTKVDVVSATELTVRTPAHAAGPVNVRVVTASKGATAESRHRRSDLFTFYAPALGVAALTSTSTDSTVSLRWHDPANTRGVTIRRLAGKTAPTERGDGTLVAHLDAKTTHLTDSHLEAGAEYSYGVFVRDTQAQFSPAVPLAARTLTTAEAAHTWSGPTRPFGLDRGAPQTISCPSTTFCQSIDSFGVVFTYNGSTWTQTSRLGNSGQPQSVQVVCASTTFCLATLDTTTVYRFDGSGWSAELPADGEGVGANDEINALACASTTFCVAGADGGIAFTYDGTSWSSGHQVDPVFRGSVPEITALSCPTSQFCLAGDTNGRVLSFNGTSWSTPTALVDFDSAISSVSCVSASFCLAASADDDSIHRFDGTSWTAPLIEIDPQSVICVSTSFCLALDQNGGAATYNGTKFSKAVPVESPLPDDAVLAGMGSCVSADFCVAAVEDGAAVRTATGWSAPTRFDPAAGGLALISCTTGPFCLATDTGGNVKTYRSGTWTSEPAIGSQVNQISCVSPTFCAAATQDGAQVFNGSSWSGDTGEPDDTLLYISCSSSTFCLAMNDEGDTYSYNGSKWTARPAPQIGISYVYEVSCTPPADCVAVAADGEDVPTSSVSVAFHATKWSPPVSLGHDYVDGVSCGSATSCVAVSSENTYTYDGSHWSAAHDLGFRLGAVSCGSPTFCVAIGRSQASVFDGATWSTPSAIGPHATALADVSCTSDGFCLVNDNDLNAYTRS